MYILHFSRSGGFLGLLKFESYEDAVSVYNTLTNIGYVCYIREKEKKS